MKSSPAMRHLNYEAVVGEVNDRNNDEASKGLFHDDTQEEKLSIHSHLSISGPVSPLELGEDPLQDETPITISDDVRLARRLVFMSQFVSQFTQCTWQFAVVLFLAEVSQYQSMLWISSYSLMSYATVMLLGAPVGLLLDRNDRLGAARWCIFIENGSIICAILACCWLLTRTEHASATAPSSYAFSHDSLSMIVMLLVHIFGSSALLMNQSFEMVLERDWIVVLSQQTATPEEWLSNTNVGLRQIHLINKVISPTVTGWIVETGQRGEQPEEGKVLRFCDMHTASIFVAALCIFSCTILLYSMSRVYYLVPKLSFSQKLHTVEGAPDFEETQSGEDKREKTFLPGDCWEDEGTMATKKPEDSRMLARASFGVYWRQSVVWAGLSFALLNSNALCFGGGMTTFLLHEGVSVGEVGLWRGLSSAVGLIGTFVYRCSSQFTTVINTGAWSIVFLFSWLTVACSSFWIDDARVSVYLLVASTAVSRIGLWVFDISVTLLYQENVPNGVRGLVGGTQQSLNSVFTIASSSLGLVFQNPDQFWIMASTGYVCIGVAMIVYLIGIYCRGDYVFKPLDHTKPG